MSKDKGYRNIQNFARNVRMWWEKVLSYLSEQTVRAGKSSFQISLNRQQMADFLAVDRSALSAVLCKLRDEGVIRFHKSE